MLARSIALVVALCAASAAAAETTMDKIEQYFKGALGVDAVNIQVWLLEANLYHGPLDGNWGPGTEDAFRDALDWMASRGAPPSLDSEDDFYNFVQGVRAALFNVDDGPSRTPTGNEFVLVTASSRSEADAVRLLGQLDQNLTANGYPSRAQVFLTTNGIFAVSGGLYSREGCQEKLEIFKSAGLIASDSYCADLGRFDPFNWTS